MKQEKSEHQDSAPGPRREEKVQSSVPPKAAAKGTPLRVVSPAPGGVCRCPYCDAPVSHDAFFCCPCRVTLVVCAYCGKPRAESAERCPHCGRVPRPVSRSR